MCEIVLLDYLLRQNGKSVKYIWVKGHTGIDGNEIVDAIAKEACSEVITENALVPSSDFSYTLKQKQLRRWQNMFNNVFKDRPTNYYLIFPEIKKKRWYEHTYTRKQMLTQFIRLASNHGRFPAHLHRISLADSDVCNLCHERADTNHLFLGCPRRINQTSKLIEDLRNMELQLPLNMNYILAQENLEVFYRVYRFSCDLQIKI